MSKKNVYLVVREPEYEGGGSYMGVPENIGAFMSLEEAERFTDRNGFTDCVVEEIPLGE